MSIQMMSDTGEDFVQNVVLQNWLGAYSNLSNVAYSELFRLLAFIDHSDLSELACRTKQIGVCSLREVAKLSEIEYAIQTVLHRKKPGAKKHSHHQTPKPKSTLAVETKFASEFLRAADDYIHNVVTLKKIPLGISYDTTLNLPAECSTAAALTDADFASAAQTLKVEVAAIKAVAMTESRGSGFADGNRPTLRYELHIFQGSTRGHFHSTHPWLSQATLKAGNPYHVGGSSAQNQEYSLLYNAMLMGGIGNRQIDAAICACSWGKFQIMGSNYDSLGWDTAPNFAKSMFLSEAEHLRAFVQYIRVNSLQTALQKQDWETFARRYNGPSYAMNNYDTHMRDNYNAIKAQEAKAAAKVPAPDPVKR